MGLRFRLVRFWDEFILGVSMEEQIRDGIESGPESRCRTLSLPTGDPGDGHKTRSTYRGTWVSHRTPYPCWSRWALEEETELKTPEVQDWRVALELSLSCGHCPHQEATAAHTHTNPVYLAAT